MFNKHQIVEEPCELKGSSTVLNTSTSGDWCAEFTQGHRGSVYSVAFSPDGRRIVSGSFDRSVRLWDPDWSSWLAIACNRLRYHPLLNQPQQNVFVTDPDFLEAASRARAICQQEVWGRK